LEGFGGAQPPQDLYLLVVLAGKTGKNHQKGMILGGVAAPGTLLVNQYCAGDRVSAVIGWSSCGAAQQDGEPY
jgi:hypothetical protein